jgi:hypothetical protein
MQLLIKFSISVSFHPTILQQKNRLFYRRLGVLSVQGVYKGEPLFFVCERGKND